MILYNNRTTECRFCWRKFSAVVSAGAITSPPLSFCQESWLAPFTRSSYLLASNRDIFIPSCIFNTPSPHWPRLNFLTVIIVTRKTRVMEICEGVEFRRYI